MNAQEVFDRTVRHLHKQGKQGKKRIGTISDNFFACRYRGDDGTMCAVGHFISDDDYVATMEGPVSELLYKYKHRPSIAPLVVHERLLQQLQGVHDIDKHWEEPNGLRNKLHETARMFALDTHVIDECFPEVGAA